VDVDTPSTPRLHGLGAAGPVVLERWFAQHGTPPPLDLARSGALPLSLRDLLRLAPEGSLDRLLDAPLDYGEGRGAEELRDAVAAAGAARCGGEVLVTHGAVEALLLTCATLVGPRRRVLVGVPAYEALRRTPAAVGAEVVEVSVWRPGADHLDLAQLCDMVDESVAAVLLNSPDNPTGAVVRAGDMAALAAGCADAGVALVVDEVALGTLDPAARHACTLPAFAAGAVVSLGDASKACGLGGLRAGWLTTASPRVLDAAARIKDLTTVGNAAPSEIAATWALRRRDALVDPVRAAAHRNLLALREWVATTRHDAALTAPRDGLVAFPWLPAAATHAATERLRRDHGVAVVPGALFGVDGHARIGLGLAPHLFAEALQRLDSALATLPAG
jgi:aspartate/methionine/tyrosine aminotransferase